MSRLPSLIEIEDEHRESNGIDTPPTPPTPELKEPEKEPKTLCAGILTGISYVSGIAYFKDVNHIYGELKVDPLVAAGFSSPPRAKARRETKRSRSI